jgi:hypothetical protein
MDLEGGGGGKRFVRKKTRRVRATTTRRAWGAILRPSEIGIDPPGRVADVPAPIVRRADVIVRAARGHASRLGISINARGRRRKAHGVYDGSGDCDGLRDRTAPRVRPPRGVDGVTSGRGRGAEVEG